MHKEEEVWPDGTHPMLFAESSCVCMPRFWTCSSIIFFVEKVMFLSFLNTEWGVSI